MNRSTPIFYCYLLKEISAIFMNSGTPNTAFEYSGKQETYYATRLSPDDGEQKARTQDAPLTAISSEKISNLQKRKIAPFLECYWVIPKAKTLRNKVNKRSC